MNASERTSSLWPYTERSGVGAAQHVERLFGEPDFRLNESERQDVARFGEELIHGRSGDVEVIIPRHEGEEAPTLDDVVRMSVAKGELAFYPECFDRVGIKWEGDQDLYGLVANKVAHGETVDKKFLRSAATYSTDWYKSHLADQLANPPDTDKDFVEPERIVVNLAPDDLLDKLQALKAYKAFCRQIHAHLQEEAPTNSREAKQTVLDIQAARINNLLAGAYPHAFNLARQLDISDPTERVEAWKQELDTVTPVLQYAYTSEFRTSDHTKQFLSGFARRLDLLRFGAAPGGEDGNYSPISPELDTFVTTLESQEVAEDPEPQLPPDVLQEMKKTRWKAPQFKKFLEAVLSESGLLSAYKTDWEELADRHGPAQDGLWQVVETPERGSLFTGDAKRVMEVPAKFSRTLLQVALSGALPVGAHEFAHVVQTRYDAELSEHVPLARIRGRRAIVGTEMGGLLQEKRIFEAAGITRPINTFYYRGLQAKLAGGNTAEVARAVHLARKNIDHGSATAQQRESSVGSALRLYRAGGHHSQPLDYLEQNLLLEALSTRPEEQVRAVSIAATSFAFEDSARLRAVDMLPMPDDDSFINPADTVLRVYMEQFHAR